MINEATARTIPYILSDGAYTAYEKIKELIQKIFSTLKINTNEKNLKEEFYDSYIDFARKLDAEEHYDESNLYMSICSMYYDLMDNPTELIAHESFFMDLFNAFDRLLYYKINKPAEYDKKYEEFIIYSGEMQDYFYGKFITPSEHYNEDTLKEIISHLSGDEENLKEKK